MMKWKQNGTALLSGLYFAVGALAMERPKLQNVSGLVGDYAHGNESCHHVAYLYNYGGQP